jgi:hypothetical protein
MKKPLQLHTDAFMSEALEDDADLVFGLEQIVDDLQPQSPSSSLESRILSSLLENRFERFTTDVASLLDVDPVQAKELLDGIDASDNWVDGPVEGMTIYHVDGGPKVARAITGFARIPSDKGFPEHKHLGRESILVLQGYFKDSVSQEVFGPGDIAHMETDSAHAFEVLPGCTTLTYLVVVQEGVEVLGMEI